MLSSVLSWTQIPEGSIAPQQLAMTGSERGLTREAMKPCTVARREGERRVLYQNMAEDHTYKGVGECHPYREFEGMQPSR